MSFVLFAGCEYFGLMIGDRRSVTIDGKIKSNNEMKVRKINENLVTCAAGTEAIIHILWNSIFSKSNYSNISYSECINLLSRKCESIKSEYLELSKNEDLFTNIGIMGIKNNTICLTVIKFLRNDIQIIEKIFDTENDPGFFFFASGKYENLSDIFLSEFYKCPKYTIQNIKSIFYRVTHKECKKDITINDSFNLEYIKRTDLIERDKIIIEK